MPQVPESDARSKGIAQVHSSSCEHALPGTLTWPVLECGQLPATGSRTRLLSGQAAGCPTLTAARAPRLLCTRKFAPLLLLCSPLALRRQGAQVCLSLLLPVLLNFLRRQGAQVC